MAPHPAASVRPGPRHRPRRVDDRDRGEGLLAQALQHETDHLDGILYLDRLEKPERRIAMREVRESDWF
ncbi:hypothetical protein GCM10025877_31330 [Agromyces mangrovi Wang et al. 2018]|nr:hypothetical protein GCM10025877_31330 [Agromyces mangrovi]